MVTRDFDALLSKKRKGKRPTFRVGGQEFTLRSKLAAQKFDRIIDAMTDDEGETPEKMERLFRSCLMPDDRDRFIELYRRGTEEGDDDDDEEAVIDVEQLPEITNWLIEYYTGKKMENSDSSSGGASTGQTPHNVVSLNPKAS